MICQEMPQLLIALLAWVLLLSSAVAQSRSNVMSPPPDTAFVKIRFGLLLAVSRIVEHVEVERDFAGRILEKNPQTAAGTMPPSSIDCVVRPHFRSVRAWAGWPDPPCRTVGRRAA